MIINIPSLVKENKAVATFDLFDTITLPEFDCDQEIWHHGFRPNKVVVEEMFRLASEGWKLYIITERGYSQSISAQTSEFVKAYKLPAQCIFYVDIMQKSDVISNLSASLHYDDDINELHELPKGCCGVLIRHPMDKPV